MRAFGGQVKIPGSSHTEFVRSVPGPVFENTRGMPTLLNWRDGSSDRTFLPVDPTLHWANPRTIEVPEPPFTAFPPGYADAQFPVPHVTHTHGLVVRPQFDGTAEEWFTPFGHRGPAFVSRDYDMPNEQPATQLFYHDHVMGVTRLGVYAGSVGAAYFIRDPQKPARPARARRCRRESSRSRSSSSTGRSSPTGSWISRERADDPPPTAVLAGRGRSERHPRQRQGVAQPERPAAAVPFPAAGRGQHAGVPVPVRPSSTRTAQLGGTSCRSRSSGPTAGTCRRRRWSTGELGITERADILVDFSQFPPGTQIIHAEHHGRRHRRRPRAWSCASRSWTARRFPRRRWTRRCSRARPVLVPDAPTRTKTLIRFRDEAETNRHALDRRPGVLAPPTEFPLVGSTEEWVIVNTAEEEEAEEGEEPDADLGIPP